MNKSADVEFSLLKSQYGDEMWSHHVSEGELVHVVECRSFIGV